MIKRLFDLLLAIPVAVMLAVPVALVALAVRPDIKGAGALLVGPHRPGATTASSGCPSSAACASARRRWPRTCSTTRSLSHADRLLPAPVEPRRTAAAVEHPQGRHELRRTTRPALFSASTTSIALRTQRGVDDVVPGLTGWAQVNGRDELPIPQKVALDVEYLERRSLTFDCT